MSRVFEHASLQDGLRLLVLAVINTACFDAMYRMLSQ